MRSPVTPLPVAVARWTRRARALRWLDALVAAMVLWAVMGTTIPVGTAAAAALVAAGAGACVAPLRRRWRPVSALVGVVVSRNLGPGDRAWHVRSDRIDRVLVTARGPNRIVIATRGPDAAEGMTVRRTRVLLIPAD